MEAKPTWLDLLVPITELILERLPLPDYIRFGAVCRQWRSIQRSHRLRHAPGPPPMPHPLPWLIPCQLPQYRLDCYSPLDHTSRCLTLPALFSDRHYTTCLTSCRGWLLLFFHGYDDDDDDDCMGSWPYVVDRPVLFNPISGTKILLPPLDESCYRGAMSAPPTDPDCTVLLYSDHRILLHRCSTGGGWTTVAKIPLDLTAITLTHSQGKFYFVAPQRRLYVIDHLLPVPTLRLLEMDRSMLTLNFDYKLVESDEDLLLVQDNMMFRADFSEKKWVRMETLGDRVLFVDCGQSFSVLAAKVGCKKNCIYCTKTFRKRSVAWKVFDLDSGGLIEGTSKLFTEVVAVGHWFFPTLDCPI